MTEEFIHNIHGIVILDADGKRMFSKYYHPDFSTLESQTTFEANVYSKSQKGDSSGSQEVDIIVLKNYVCVFKHEVDLFFYLFADKNENELVCAEVLSALIDALQLIFRNQLEKRTLLENFDLIVLAVDEVLESGIIMEIDPQTIHQKVVSTETGFGATTTGDGDVDALSQVFAGAKDQVAEIASSLFSF